MAPLRKRTMTNDFAAREDSAESPSRETPLPAWFGPTLLVGFLLAAALIGDSDFGGEGPLVRVYASLIALYGVRFWILWPDAEGWSAVRALGLVTLLMVAYSIVVAPPGWDGEPMPASEWIHMAIIFSGVPIASCFVFEFSGIRRSATLFVFCSIVEMALLFPLWIAVWLCVRMLFAWW